MPSPDRALVLSRVSEAEWDVLRFTVPGQPVPKARPRWAPRGGTYTSPRTVEAEKRIGEYLKGAYPHLRPSAARMGLSIEVYLNSGRQGDADNYLKLVADSCTGKVWLDDKQVDEMYVRLFRNASVPMTTIRIYKMEVLA